MKVQRRIAQVWLAVLTLFVAVGSEASAGMPDLPDAVWRLIGDRFVWGDVAVQSGWRVQENGLSGECRLLDGADGTVAKGDCSVVLAAFRQVAPRLSDEKAPLVVLVHGLGGARMDFSTLTRRLTDAGYRIESIAYPSILGDLDAHANRLNAVLNGMPGSGPITVVAHSMGALVARMALAKDSPWRHRRAVAGLVMIGAPNRGASLARTVGDLLPILGPAAEQLLPGNAGEIPKPSVRYCIVAGAQGDGTGINPAIPGDDDGIVALDEARITASDDTLIVRDTHQGLLSNAQTFAAVDRFLKGSRCSTP